MTELQTLRQRVVQLEELFSHHEQLVQQLNDTIVSMHAEQDKLQAMCVEQGRRLEALLERQAQPLDPNEKPPHY